MSRGAAWALAPDGLGAASFRSVSGEGDENRDPGNAVRTPQSALMRLAGLAFLVPVLVAACSSSPPTSYTLHVGGWAEGCRSDWVQYPGSSLAAGDQIQVLDNSGRVLAAATLAQTSTSCWLSTTVHDVPKRSLYQAWKDCLVCQKTVVTFSQLKSDGWRVQLPGGGPQQAP